MGIKIKPGEKPPKAGEYVPKGSRGGLVNGPSITIEGNEGHMPPIPSSGQHWERIKLAIKYKSDREFIKKLINNIELPIFSDFKNTKDFVKAVNNIVSSILKNVQLDRDLVIAEISQKLNFETKNQGFSDLVKKIL
jgi:hypothetical protein